MIFRMETKKKKEMWCRFEYFFYIQWFLYFFLKLNAEIHDLFL